MKIWISLIASLMFFLFMLPAYADNASTSITLKNIKVPSNPAFELMGISPTQINKPSTPREIGLCIQNAINGNNLAVEIAPFQMGDKSNPKNETDIYNDKIGENFLNNLSLSVAQINDASGTQTILGYGVRTVLVTGKSSYVFKEQKENFQKEIKDLPTDSFGSLNQLLLTIATDPNSDNATIYNNYLQSVETNLKKHPTMRDSIINYFKANVTPTSTNAKITSVAEDINKNYFLEPKQKEIDLIVNKYKKIDNSISETTDWTWEVGYAVVNEHPKANPDNFQTIKKGFWTTIGYTPDKLIFNTSSYTLLVTYKNTTDTQINNNITDFGGKFILYPASTSNMAVAYEYINHNINGNDFTRSVFILEYKLADDTYLTGSYGRDFNGAVINPTSNPNMVAALGLNWGFGESPSIAIPAQ